MAVGSGSLCCTESKALGELGRSFETFVDVALQCVNQLSEQRLSERLSPTELETKDLKFNASVVSDAPVTREQPSLQKKQVQIGFD